MNKKDFLITAIILVLAIALIATIIIVKKADKAANGETAGTTSGVVHDHDGDGVPDHGDDAHGSENNDGTTGTTEGTSGGNSTGDGGNVDAVVPDDSDIDIGIEIEDLPSDGGSSGTDGGNTGTTDGGGSGTTDGGSSGTTDGGSTEGGSTEGGSTEGGSTEGGSSGAVSGNEIDFDDLLNAGKN